MEADAYLEAMQQQQSGGGGSGDRTASDELACVNVAKAWPTGTTEAATEPSLMRNGALRGPGPRNAMQHAQWHYVSPMNAQFSGSVALGS